MGKRTVAEGKLRKYKLLRFWVSLLDAVGWAVLIFATVAMVIAIGTLLSPDIAKLLKTQDMLDDIPRMIIICIIFYVMAIILLCIGEILSALLNITEDALYIKDLVDRKLVDTRPDIQALQAELEGIGHIKVGGGKGSGVDGLKDFLKAEFKKNEEAQKVTGEFLLKTQERSTKERRVLSDFIYNHLNEIQTEITELHELINVTFKNKPDDQPLWREEKDLDKTDSIPDDPPVFGEPASTDDEIYPDDESEEQSLY